MTNAADSVCGVRVCSVGKWLGLEQLTDCVPYGRLSVPVMAPSLLGGSLVNTRGGEVQVLVRRYVDRFAESNEKVCEEVLEHAVEGPWDIENLLNAVYPYDEAAKASQVAVYVDGHLSYFAKWVHTSPAVNYRRSGWNVNLVDAGVIQSMHDLENRIGSWRANVLFDGSPAYDPTR
jgi:hypothetical protein